jgi:hypothetical protein
MRCRSVEGIMQTIWDDECSLARAKIWYTVDLCAGRCVWRYRALSWLAPPELVLPGREPVVLGRSGAHFGTGLRSVRGTTV